MPIIVNTVNTGHSQEGSTDCVCRSVQARMANRHSHHESGPHAQMALQAASCPTRHTRPFVGFTAILLLSAGLPLMSGGCAMFRAPQNDDVATARRLAMQGMDAMQRDKWPEAERLFREAAAASPTDPRARSLYAETLWQRGARDESLGQMEKAVELSGADPAMAVRLGKMYLARGELYRAHQQAENALGSDRTLAAAWALKGDVFTGAGKHDDALASYHRALSHQPELADVQLAVAKIYRIQQRPYRALSVLDALVRGFPQDQAPSEVYLQRGLVLKELGRHFDAAESLAIGVASAPGNVELLYELSDARLQAGNAEGARLALEQALAISPHHQPSRRLMDRVVDQSRLSAIVPTQRVVE